MKLFTLFIITVVLSVSLFSNGQQEEPMEAEKMVGSDAMMSSDAMGTMMMIEPFPDFVDLKGAMVLAESKPTILFFYASWCPTCKAAKIELQDRVAELMDINLLIVDYDNSDDLQKKYGVTYQHTFVQIDENGMAIEKWNGGGVDMILDSVIVGGKM